MTSKFIYQRHLDSETHTERFAEQLSLFLQPGMVLLLKGELGAGKSTFARALIRALADSKGVFDIPSPTFALVQTYDNTRIPVAHVDLYRTSSESEILQLGLADMVASHLLIIEWPRPSIENLSSKTIVVEFSGSGNTRDIEISGDGICSALIKRLNVVEDFLNRSGWGNATRKFLNGDASFRRYERLENGQSKSILMDMPKRPDGPVIKDGKPYSAIAHLAEGLRSVVAINDYLLEQGYAAPKIVACDIEAGLALIEDFGDALYGDLRANNFDMVLPMKTAVEVLVKMANQSWPKHVTMRDHSVYELPNYDREAQLIEVDLLINWYFPHVKSVSATPDQAEGYQKLWAEALEYVQPVKPVWVLRDFHSPNLIWRYEQSGEKRVGLIDTQDALVGHPAYDLVSLLQDARIDIPVDEQTSLYDFYGECRQEYGTFDSVEFGRAYAVLGAQRATKILGIFARLAKRDGKLSYLKHMPRVSRYLERDLRHPALARLRGWYEKNIPEAIGAAK